MTSDEPVNLADFQQQIIDWHRMYEREFEVATIYSENKYPAAHSTEQSGLVGSIFKRLMRWIAKVIFRVYWSSTTLRERKERSIELTTHPEVRRIVCEQLNRSEFLNLSKNDLVLGVISVLSTKLLESQVAERLSIEREPRLFALMTYSIVRRGIKEYCSLEKPASSTEIVDLDFGNPIG